MNGQSFASLALSLLMVGLAAVVFRPSERGPVAGSPIAEPALPRLVPESDRSPEVARSSPIPDRESAIPVSTSPRSRLASTAVVKPLSAGPPPTTSSEGGGVIRSPGSAFTQVEPGETLALVARRVYGSSAARERLWRGNRDLLPDPEAALRPGTILRTP